AGKAGVGRSATTPLRLVSPRAVTTPASSCGKGSRCALIQSPERSGFPSGVRGARPSISTRPWSSRGTPASLYFGHWAKSEPEHAISTAIAAACIFIGVLLLRHCTVAALYESCERIAGE